MTEAYSVQLAKHEERLDAVEKRVESVESKFDTLKNWIMGVLASSVLGLIGTVVGLLSRK